MVTWGKVTDTYNTTSICSIKNYISFKLKRSQLLCKYIYTCSTSINSSCFFLSATPVSTAICMVCHLRWLVWMYTHFEWHIMKVWSTMTCKQCILWDKLVTIWRACFSAFDINSFSCFKINNWKCRTENVNIVVKKSCNSQVLFKFEISWN